MSEKQEIVRLADTTANPAPLGLMGFGLTTVLLNLHNIGLFGVDSMIMAMGIFFGGAAQVVVGKMEWKKNNMFGTVAFSSYGFFWMTLVATWVFPKMGWAEASTPTAMGWYLTVWGLLSTALWVCTFRHGKAMQILFGMVVVLFFLLAAANFTGSHLVHLLGGIDGVLCGGFAMYCASATLINDAFGKQVLPL